MCVAVIRVVIDCLRGDDGGDEELGTVGVLASVGHGEETLLGVLELEVLVLELLAVDCEKASMLANRLWGS
jgi:hypothetical protein